MNRPLLRHGERRLGSIPPTSGLGLKAQHIPEILETLPDVGWFEVHSENYMGAGGPPHRALTAVREHYQISVHGVGMSLGGEEPLDAEHLARFKDVVDRYEPGLVSEHLAWTSAHGVHLNDLLPVPLTAATLQKTAENVEQMQDALRRPILVENPSTYIEAADAEMTEPEFLIALANRTGCGLLIDVNNVYVSAENHQWAERGMSAEGWLAQIPVNLIGEVHLAGHAVEIIDGHELRVDDHGSPVSMAVWNLYEQFIDRVGAVPTLIERDKNIPPLAELMEEVRKLDAVLDHAKVLGPLLGNSHG